MTVRTCTKVNVGLNVLRKRPDGYHDLETLFVPYYGYSDTITVEPSKYLTIDIDHPDYTLWDPFEDLTVKAWRLLKADFPQLPAVSIHLVKQAPVGAGLGGGSADAAFMLRTLNEMFSLGLDTSALADYAARLGSDCAFFVYAAAAAYTKTIPLRPQGTGEGSPETPSVASLRTGSNTKTIPLRPQGTGEGLAAMFATGRGEILEPFDIDLSAYELQVEVPLDSDGKPVAVSTREAYAGIVPRDLWTSAAGAGAAPLRPTLALTNRRSERCCSDSAAAEADLERPLPLREALRLPAEQWRGLVVNDFEASVCPQHPEIPALIADFYRRGAVYASMSGSGSAVFGLFRK